MWLWLLARLFPLLVILGIVMLGGALYLWRRPRKLRRQPMNPSLPPVPRLPSSARSIGPELQVPPPSGRAEFSQEQISEAIKAAVRRRSGPLLALVLSLAGFVVLLTACRPLPSPALLMEQEARAYFDAARAVRNSPALIHDRTHVILCEESAAAVVEKAHAGYPDVTAEATAARAEMLADCAKAKIKPASAVDAGTPTDAAHAVDGGGHVG